MCNMSECRFHLTVVFCNIHSDTSGKFPLSIYKIYKRRDHFCNFILVLVLNMLMCFFVFLKFPMSFTYSINVFKNIKEILARP